MQLPRRAALQQSAVVEEHVHELPEHVVERLDELLADRCVLGRRFELPLRAHALERDGEAAELAGRLDGRGGVPERDRHVVGLDQQPHLPLQRAALRAQGERRQRPLAHDHRVHELDRHVPGVRACGRGPAERDQAAVAGEALRHPVAEASQPLRLGLEESAVCPCALSERALEDVCPERLVHTPTRSADAIRASHSRHSSMPSPVLALTSMCSTPGCTDSRL